MDISTYGGCILMYNFLFEGKPNYKEGYMDLKGMIL
jgi:hypothetical protein